MSLNLNLKLLVILFYVSFLADMVTTKIGLSLGYAETNIIMLYLFSIFTVKGVMLGGIFIFGIMSIGYLLAIDKNNIKVNKTLFYVLAVLTSVRVIVVYLNILVISS